MIRTSKLTLSSLSVAKRRCIEVRDLSVNLEDSYRSHQQVTNPLLSPRKLRPLPFKMQNNNKQQTVDGEENMVIQGFRMSYFKVLFTVAGVLLSCSLLWMLMSWRKRFFMHCTHIACSLETAERVLIVDAHGQEYISKIERPPEKSTAQNSFFYYKRIKYMWNSQEKQFVTVGGLPDQSCSQLQASIGGLDSTEARLRLQLYGPNRIHIEVKPVVKLLLRELKNPFYIYQAFIVIVWCLQLYYQFAVCIVLLSVISVSSTVWETRKQSRSLRDAMHSESVATVVRDGKEITKPSTELVPGDILVLSRSPFIMFCDAILLSGNCVVNESMLTGESVAITKVPIPDEPDIIFDAVAHKRSILSCGTEVLLSRNVDASEVKAIVYRTGFSTAKGELVRAILYPKPVKLKLYSDLLKCMVMFFILGIPSLIYTIVVGIRLDLYVKDSILFVLNVGTFFVPPSLPAVLTSINQQAQRRLRKQGIFCLNTRYINFSGVLDVVCFDKTGTLTEDNLDILDIVPVQSKKFKELQGNADCMLPENFVRALGTCHSLSRIDGGLLGYDLDLKMFEASEWNLQEPSPEDEVPFEYKPPRIVHPKSADTATAQSVAIVRQFPFESTLKRMTVVTQSQGSKLFEVFLKGAPELVMSLCRKDTVPDDIEETLRFYTSQGFRVIGVATKLLPSKTSWNEILRMRREDLENELELLGLVVLENKLKLETVPSLNILKSADIRLVMVTGDNLLTAITVGKKCGILNECDKVVIMEADSCAISDPKEKLKVTYKLANSPILNMDLQLITSKDKSENFCVPIEANSYVALEGQTFNLLRLHNKELLEKVIVKGAIFARMSPENKLHLIEYFQDLGYQVGMCGDGANDCGALKTAHTGVSLSMAEASVAAPFTSSQQNIQCIPSLIREGRVTLVSTFDSFKYMVCYTLTFLVGVLMLFWDGQKPSDGAYLTIDIILNLIPPFLFGATTAFPGLVKKKPPRSIISFIPLFSIFSFIAIQIGVHSFAHYYCLSQSWYSPFNFDKEHAHAPEASYSGTTLLTVNMMVYITAAAIFASGPPFRNTFFSNKPYVCVLAAQFVLVSYLSLYPPEFMIHFLNFKRAPVITYNLTLYIISLGILLICFVYEKLFVQRFLSCHVVPAIQRRRGPVRKFEKLQKKLCDEHWPPV